MNHPRFFRCFLVLTILSSLCTTAFGEVYVNRLWDEHWQEYRVKVLYQEGYGVTFDRMYQNAYGEENDLDPGPPFIIEAGIVCINLYDDDGMVEGWGKISFESGGFGMTQPFNIYVQVADPQESRISGAGGVQFLGSFLDPISISGNWEIQSGSHGGADPIHQGQHEVVWSNTNFTVQWDPDVWNNSSILFYGGDVTIQDCNFEGWPSELAYILAFSDLYTHVGEPVWDVVLHNNRFANSNLENSSEAVLLSKLRRVTVEDCHFENIQFFESNSAGVMDVRDCGIVSIRNNTASNNAMDVIEMDYGWAAGDARIKTNDGLVIRTTNFFIPEDSSLAIEPGSVIKFPDYQSGLVVEGDLTVDNATLTSMYDERHGADADPDPMPETIALRWGTGGGAGICVDTSGTATLTDSRILHAEGGVRAFNDITVRGCTFDYGEDFGLLLQGPDNERFVVSNTTFRRSVDGFAPYDAAIFYENRSSHSQILDIDGVTMKANHGHGLEVSYVAGSPTVVEVDSCTFVGNEQYGIRFAVDPAMLEFSVRRSVVSANGAGGIVGIDFSGNDVPIQIEGNVIVGNALGRIDQYGHGVHIPNGTLRLVNNTTAYNRRMGASVYGLDDIEQCHIASNLFLGNGEHGLFKGDDGAPIMANNLFWQNSDEEIRYRGPEGWLYTLAEVQALGGEFETNFTADPLLVPTVVGESDSLTFYDHFHYTRLIDDGAGFGSQNLVGRLICPDTNHVTWHYIFQQSMDTLYMWGNATDSAAAGSTYRIMDYHLSDLSPAVDMGRNTSVTMLYELDGDNRYIDGDEDGGIYVDIGADEYNPDAGYEAPIRVSSPSANKFLAVGDSAVVRWEADSSANVNILYTDEILPQFTWWDTLAKGVDASAGEHRWKVGFGLSRKCQVKVEDAANSSVYAYSSMFTVKYRVLARELGDSTLLAFTPENDGWRFGNDQAHNWDPTWYAQFDYVNGVDPVTNQIYPPLFTIPMFVDAKSSDFPDWPSFARAYGVDQCYVPGASGLEYRPSALIRWKDIKSDWNGSCYGYGVSCGLAFFDSTGFVTQYPEVGAYSFIHDLDSSAARRNLITELYSHQFGRYRRAHDLANWKKTPRQTLADLKEVMDDNFANAPMLVIGSVGANSGAHVVTPYRIDSIAGQPGKFAIMIYDNNHAPPDILVTELFLEIDSSANTWSYTDFPQWVAPHSFLYVMDSSASYLEPPVMQIGSPGITYDQIASVAGQVEIYFAGATDFVMTDTTGTGPRSGFRDDTVWNSSPDAFPVIPKSGLPGRPIGYIKPAGPFSVELGSDTDSSMSLTVWDSTMIYQFHRSGVDSTHLDRINYTRGMEYTNGEDVSKPLGLVCVNATAEAERMYRLTGFQRGLGEMIKWKSVEGDSLNLFNNGSGLTFDLELCLVSSTGCATVTCEDIPFLSLNIGVIEPDWSDPTLSTVWWKVGLTPTDHYTDSTLLNVITDVGQPTQGSILPERFELGQSYPNPFNSSCLIEYNLPVRSSVTLDILNILGQRVRTLVSTEQEAGTYRVQWNGRDEGGNDVATGVYLYRLKAADFTQTRKMLLLK